MFLKFNQKVAILNSMTLIFLPVLGVVTLSSSALAQTRPCTCVSSDAQPQRGQKNRSSGNFSTQGCSNQLLWQVPQGVSFTVMQDVSGGRDPVVIPNASNGARTANPGKRSLYIANPNSGGRGFQVCVYSM